MFRRQKIAAVIDSVSLPRRKIGVLPILTTAAVPFRLQPVSNTSAADQHCVKRWHTTGVALAKHRRSTTFQCWQTTNICGIAKHRCSTESAPAQYQHSVLANNQLLSNANRRCSTSVVPLFSIGDQQKSRNVKYRRSTGSASAQSQRSVLANNQLLSNAKLFYRLSLPTNILVML